MTEKERRKDRKKEKKKERKRAKNKIKSAHLWLLLIVIKLTYTRIGFVSLIYVLVCQGSVPLVQRTRFFCKQIFSSRLEPVIKRIILIKSKKH